MFNKLDGPSSHAWSGSPPCLLKQAPGSQYSYMKRVIKHLHTKALAEEITGRLSQVLIGWGYSSHFDSEKIQKTTNFK